MEELVYDGLMIEYTLDYTRAGSPLIRKKSCQGITFETVDETLTGTSIPLSAAFYLADCMDGEDRYGDELYLMKVIDLKFLPKDFIVFKK